MFGVQRGRAWGIGSWRSGSCAFLRGEFGLVGVLGAQGSSGVLGFFRSGLGFRGFGASRLRGFGFRVAGA